MSDEFSIIWQAAECREFASAFCARLGKELECLGAAIDLRKSGEFYVANWNGEAKN
jgi:hypothetical protein